MRAPEFWHENGWPAHVLAPLGALYGLTTRMKHAAARSYRARAAVVCVGNLTAGGTGKTPLALALARMLILRKAKVVFLTRGYGGHNRGPHCVDPATDDARTVGDEPLLLAATAPTVVARDRAAGAHLAESLAADVIVMDDGLQNFALVKDVSLAVIDAETGLGNGRPIPAGPLREDAACALARADALVLMGDGAPTLPSFAGPVLRAHLLPSAPENLRAVAVVAFAGIGRPVKFFAMLQAMGASVAIAQGFADHHVYSRIEIQSLRNAAARAKALLVTTEKDYVRIPPEERRGIVPVPVHVAVEPDLAWDMLLDRLTQPAEERQR